LGDFVVQKAEKGCVNVENEVKLGEQRRRKNIAGLGNFRLAFWEN